MPSMPSSGAISHNDLASVFGGSTPHSLSEYYRGGQYVPNITANNNVPTSGTITLSNFYNARTVNYGSDWTPVNLINSQGRVFGFNNVRGLTQSGTNSFIVCNISNEVANSTDNGATWTSRRIPKTVIDAISSSAQANHCASNGSLHIIILSSANNTYLTTTDFITWTARTGISSAFPVDGLTRTIQKIKWDGSQFIATGTNGFCVRSSDGINWSYSFLGTYQTINDISKSGSLYIAVGNRGTCATSSDNGATWTLRTGFGTAFGTTTTAHAYAVAGSGSMIIAVGAGGRCVSSPDGITWTNQITPYTTAGGVQSVAIAYYNTYFCVFCYNSGTLQLLTTTNASPSTWTNRGSLRNIAGQTSSYNSVGSLNVVVGSSALMVGGYAGVVLTSTDALNYTYRSGLINPTVSLGRYQNLVIGGNSSTLVSAGFQSLAATASPTNLNSWTTRTGLTALTLTSPAAFNNINSILWTNSNFVVFGGYAATLTAGSGSSFIATSPDGITWTMRTLSSSIGPITTAANIGGTVVAIASGSSSYAYSTDHGVTWTISSNIYTSFGNFTTISYITTGNGRFLLTANGYTGYSFDGINWTTSNQLASLTSNQGAIVYANGFYYLKNMFGAPIYRSTDALTWSVFSNAATTDSSYYRLVYFNGVFVNSGNQSIVYYSTDLVNWSSFNCSTITETNYASGDQLGVDRVVYEINGRLYLLDREGKLLVSNL